MDSVDVPTTLLCDQQQETTDKSEIKCEIKFEIKCEKFESTAPNTSTETAENGCDMAHDDSSDSGSGIHDETAQNSTAAIDTLVISDEKNMPQLEALLNQVSACQKNNNNDGSFIKTGCNLNDSNESMNAASYDGTLQYSNALLNDTLMNPVIAQATSAKQKFPNGQSKMKREWRVVGWFTSEATMNEVRKREKVSKRKSVAQINGTKVFYRCNNWRRTNCNFRMYALYHAPDQITLYASGDHDHTTKNPHYVPRSYNGNATCNAVSPSSSSAAQALSSPAQKRKQPRPQQEQQYQSALNNLFMNNKSSLLSLPFSRTSSQPQTSLGTKNRKLDLPQSSDVPLYLDAFIKNTVKNGHRNQLGDVPSYLDSILRTEMEQSVLNERLCAKSNGTDGISGNDKCASFQLSDGNTIVQLLQLATQIDHTFTFNSRRNSEYCFESNVLRGKVVAFRDLGDFVSVVERWNGFEKSSEQWKKADWSQFVWAVRGKCTNLAKCF